MVSKIAIFGGTGMTGAVVVEYALNKGKIIWKIVFVQKNKKSFKSNHFVVRSACHRDIWFFLLISIGLSVRLLYRNESTIPETFKNRVELIQGDVTNANDVNKTLDGVDGVIVTLGTRNKLEPTTEMSTGLQNIVDEMKKRNIRPISVCLSSFLFWEQDKVPKQFEHLNAEHKRMLDIIKASSLDFIAILPPHISKEPSSEHKILHDQSPGRVVSINDLAKFFVESLSQPEHFGKVCGIAKTTWSIYFFCSPIYSFFFICHFTLNSMQCNITVRNPIKDQITFFLFQKC